jgi:hypothetical protein
MRTELSLSSAGVQWAVSPSPDATRPDIVERILAGQPTVALAPLLKPFPVEWEVQRQRFL